MNQAQASGHQGGRRSTRTSAAPNHLFINQANTQQIGTSEVDLLAKEIGYQGQIAILSAEATATNQNSWIRYMKQELDRSTPR